MSFLVKEYNIFLKSLQGYSRLKIHQNMHHYSGRKEIKKKISEEIIIIVYVCTALYKFVKYCFL